MSAEDEAGTERYLRAQIQALRTDAKVVAEHREAERSNSRSRIEALEETQKRLSDALAYCYDRRGINFSYDEWADLCVKALGRKPAALGAGNDGPGTLRAEKAEAEAKALREALCRAALRNDDDGPCFCVVPIPQGSAHHLSCQHIRRVLGGKS